MKKKNNKKCFEVTYKFKGESKTIHMTSEHIGYIIGFFRCYEGAELVSVFEV